MLRVVAAAVPAVFAILLLVGRDDRPVPSEPPRQVLSEAAARQRRGCDDRPDFRVYTLGPRFERLDASRFSDRCETHADAVTVFYGPCRSGGESGCGYDVSVITQPACLRPRELALAFARRKATTLRGVPAVIDPSTYTTTLLTRDTLITISADARPARAAVTALRPAAGPAPRILPRPNASVVDGKLRNAQCPA